MIFNLFKKRKTPDEVIVNAVVSQTAALISDLNQRMEMRFREISSQIKEVELGLAQMETKLLTKDLKDKQAYGLLHYKLHEVKSPRIDDEVKSLEAQLAARKPTLKDQ